MHIFNDTTQNLGHTEALGLNMGERTGLYESTVISVWPKTSGAIVATERFTRSDGYKDENYPSASVVELQC